MNVKKEKELKVIYIINIILFISFLFFPIIRLFLTSFNINGSIGLENYLNITKTKGFLQALKNSIVISIISSLISTTLGFLLAYTINYTNINKSYKKLIKILALIPMLLPTLTYGFAIIYSFGKQGLLTKIFKVEFFEIYGFNGLLLCYIIYTLPVSFLLILNTMNYIDKKFIVVSKLMKDNIFKTFYQTVLRPLLGTFAISIVQCFFLCFTDYGIPASIGGKYEVVSTILYNKMLGSTPNFGEGSVVAIIMLIPSILSILLLKYLEKFNIRYNKISNVELSKNKIRDICLAILSTIVIMVMVSIFLVIIIIPFIEEWPYKINFTLDNIKYVLMDNNLISVYKNSIIVSLGTAILGTLISYGCALITTRSNLNNKLKLGIDSVALVTNTVPGMVIGVSYMLLFSGSFLQNTFILIILCNIIHFFSTPYLMMKTSLEKLNNSWETTASLMGDNWIKTIIRILTPNMKSTLLEVFSYYFIHSMVTVSAIIFIAGAKTIVLTTKIKELQYYTKFKEVFILSIFILLTNLIVKIILSYIIKRSNTKENKKTNKKGKIISIVGITLIGLIILLFTYNNSSSNIKNKVIIYSNADEEAIEAIKSTLDNNSYLDKYIIQNFGTSELGGKLLAEGTNIEADLIILSSFYLDTAQQQNNVLQKLNFDYNLLNSSDKREYYAQLTSQEGAIIVNTKVLEENNLPMPKSLKYLANPIYKNFISVIDINSSSTAWLLIQGLISEYGEEEAKTILTAIYENAGHHIETSGSAPLKKVRVGEVAIGFGLRQQAFKDKKQGLPIDYIDPIEGNFALTESISVIDKGEKTKALSQEIAQCIVEKARPEMQKYYPNALYEGEITALENASKYPKIFKEPLTAELLKKHQQFSEQCK